MSVLQQRAIAAIPQASNHKEGFVVKKQTVLFSDCYCARHHYRE
jgi:hypothetical protein